MLLSLYSVRVVEQIPIRIKTAYHRLSSVNLEKDGTFVRGTEVVYYDSLDDLNRFNSSDFYISSIVAVGATQMLKPVTMVSMSDMAVADKFENFNISGDVQES